MRSAAAVAPQGAFIVVDGRRWRASDPRIPAPFRQELVNELMAARRGVKTATSDAALRRWRARVNHAKLALGERGRVWWLPPDARARRRRIEATIRALLHARHDGSICPSDVARTIGGAEWRAILPAVRTHAASLARRGSIVIRRRGRVVTEDLTSGVLRYALRAKA